MGFDLRERTCVIEDCERPHLARGLCQMHYMRKRRTGDPLRVRTVRLVGDLTTRFWGRVNKNGARGCWEWRGALSGAGYGQIGAAGRVMYAHRVSYELEYGPVPIGREVCHKCDNRRCVNPAHLYAGTRADNVADRLAPENRYGF